MGIGGRIRVLAGLLALAGMLAVYGAVQVRPAEAWNSAAVMAKVAGDSVAVVKALIEAETVARADSDSASEARSAQLVLDEATARADSDSVSEARSAQLILDEATARADSDSVHREEIDLNTAHRGTTSGNPHSVTATEVGLGNVENVAHSTTAHDSTFVGDNKLAISTTAGLSNRLGLLLPKLSFNDSLLQALKVKHPHAWLDSLLLGSAGSVTLRVPSPNVLEMADGDTLRYKALQNAGAAYQWELDKNKFKLSAQDSAGAFITYAVAHDSAQVLTVDREYIDITHTDTDSEHYLNLAMVLIDLPETGSDSLIVRYYPTAGADSLKWRLRAKYGATEHFSTGIQSGGTLNAWNHGAWVFPTYTAGRQYEWILEMWAKNDARVCFSGMYHK